MQPSPVVQGIPTRVSEIQAQTAILAVQVIVMIFQVIVSGRQTQISERQTKVLENQAAIQDSQNRMSMNLLHADMFNLEFESVRIVVTHNEVSLRIRATNLASKPVIIIGHKGVLVARDVNIHEEQVEMQKTILQGSEWGDFYINFKIADVERLVKEPSIFVEVWCEFLCMNVLGEMRRVRGEWETGFAGKLFEQGTFRAEKVSKSYTLDPDLVKNDVFFDAGDWDDY